MMYIYIRRILCGFVIRFRGGKGSKYMKKGYKGSVFFKCAVVSNNKHVLNLFGLVLETKTMTRGGMSQLHKNQSEMARQLISQGSFCSLYIKYLSAFFLSYKDWGNSDKAVLQGLAKVRIFNPST